MHVDELPSELLQDIFQHLANIPAPKDYMPSCYDEHVVPCVEVIYSPDERYAKSNLAKCALVSRHWCINVRPLLFRTLALRFTPIASEPGTRTLQDIAVWLRTSGVRSFVQEFRLILTQRDEGSQIGLLWGEALHYDASMLFHILFSFSYLRALKLVDVRLDRFAQFRPAVLDSDLKKPSTLNLESFHYIFNKCSPFCGSQSLPDLLYLLTWFGEVKDLYIGFVPLILGPEHSTKGLVFSKGLQVSNASIEGDLSIHLIIESLCQTLKVDLSLLKSLSVSINILGEDVLDHIPPLVEMIAPHTHNLSINMIGLLTLAHGGIHSIPNSYTAFDLSTFTSLQTLRFDIPVGHIELTSMSYEQLVWWYISNIISTTTRLPLQEVTVVLQFNGPTSMHGLLAGCSTFMAQIDSMLAKIPSMRKFKLCKRGTEPSEEEVKKVEGLFEELKGRGALEYKVADDEAEVEHLIEIIPGLQE
ncbi:hypothetical protein BDY19DRAFT_186563 [Irpex rosettiformis]|uniref:Uncharacterized protein n=1 Tax=Irpex rosettiformis TaxID=378272 RepID=A0ACB8U249_9APHY|nr:hypothetical protein BDY19DRAFT_186563 [Irpex rosettiformis]